MYADNVYSFPAYLSCGTVCKTNLTPFTLMRAPGIAQSMFVTETAIEAMAAALSMDANAVRVLNFLQVVRRPCTLSTSLPFAPSPSHSHAPSRDLVNAVRDGLTVCRCHSATAAGDGIAG
jgi:CO/xanthine dehydrogenase Mo-binding subunit